MGNRFLEAGEGIKEQNLSGRLNPQWADARTVDPNNLPAFMKPQPEPKSIGQAVAEAITTAVGNHFEAREEEATSQAREQYQNYQNEEIAQPVGVGNMLASARQSVNDTLNTPVWKAFGGMVQTAEDAASARAADSEAEYRKSMDDVQNPIAPTYDNPVDTFFHAGLAGGLVGDSYKKSVENTLAFTSNWVRSTEIYNNFNFQWDTPEKNRMSEELARAYGKDSGIFFGDRDAYIKGAQILAQFKIDSRVGDDVDRNDPEAFKAYIAEYYPSLANATPDTFEAMLKNAEDVKAVQSITGILALGAETFNNSSERADIYDRAYVEGRTLTEEEMERAKQLTARLEELNKMTPQTTMHPLMGILSQTGIKLAGMGSDAAVGAVAAGILGGGAYMMGAPAPISKKIGSYAFKFGTMAGMYRRQVGEKYIEYLSYQNEDETRTLTPREAKIAATIETGIETGIEFWNYDAIMSTLSGADRKAIQDIVARNKGNAEAIKGGLKGYLATAVKSWAPRAKEEILEEAYQSATGDVVKNAIIATHPQTTEKPVSVAEIVGNSVDAMAEAVPSVGGMIIGGDVLSNIKGVRSLVNIARLHNELTAQEVDNAFTGQMLRDIQENQKENKLFKENPKAYMQVIKTEMDKAGLPNVYVDVEMLMNEKGGEELVQKLGQQSGYSPSEIQQVIDSKGDLEVPTEVYCQTALPANDKIVDMTTSAPDINCTARQKDTIKRFQQNVKALAEQDEQEVQEIIPTIVNENFKDEDERNLAAEIISASPNDVQNAYKKALRDAETEYKNVLREVWERDEADSKDGLTGTRVVEDKFADDNGNVRVVQNRGKSRHKWWTDYFGIQTPTVEKKEQYAYDVLTGATRGGPRSLGVAHDLAADHGDTDEVTRIEAEFKANKERLDKMANTIATLRGMKDKIAKIQNVETTITRGMTPEAYRVYQRTTDLLSASPNKKVQQAARYDGVLFARMCQRLAEEWTRQGKKTTAEDVAKGLNIVPAGGVADGKTLAHKYNQQQSQIQGQTTVTGDMISLFDAADQSTFMHETAHWYLINMRKLALNEKASRQFVEDFMTLQQWFGNKKIDADISVEQHEKFARGFEAYLRTGKAPAPQLHGIFNRFKSWLTSIYRDFKQLGGKPTKEVTAVMDRMLATQDEIDMAMKEQMVDDFKRAGGMKLMLDENARTWERWYQKVREEAEAKVLEKAMKDLEEADRKDIEDAIEVKREQVASEMGQDDFWRADEMVRMNGGNLDILADFNLTPEEYQEELKKRGGSFEAALDAQMKGFTDEMQESRLDTEALYEDAKKAVQDSEYQEMLHALEYEALAAKARAYIAGEDEVAAKKQAKADKATAKANAEAAEAAEKARKISEKLEVQEDLRNEKVKEAQTEMRNMKAGIRIVRDTVLKTVSERRAMARQSLSTLPINQATNVALWAKKLGQKQYEVFQLMSKGEWAKAANAKQQQLLLAAMVTESGRFKKLIDQQAARIQKNIQTLQKGNERMPAAERYWYQHLAYVLGLARNDGLPPANGIPKLEELFLWLTGSPNEKESEVKIPQWLDALGNQTQRIGMEKLSPNGWEYVNKIMKALYKMSRQKDKLNVVELNGVKGARIDEAASALADNLIEHNGIHIKEDPYDANRWTDKIMRNMKEAKDFLGSYFNKLITPLTIFQRMDGYIGKTGKNVTGLAIKTLYDPVMRATNEEIKLQAEFAAGLKDAFGAYTGEELDDIRNKRIYRFGNRLLTKEQIMCMALNAGTESGYKRVLDNEPVGQEFKSLQIRERVVADLFNEVLKELDKRDWATITKVWNLMGAHYEDESGVKERTTGIPLGKLAHRSFSVTGKDGNTYQLRGGYYPVVYDSDQSVRTSDLEEMDTLKSMAPGLARMGQGKGFTKSRATTVTDRPLSLSFDVIGNKGGEMMHYIASRETALDVNRIINDRKFTKAVVDSMGMEEYRTLQEWASDIWQAPKGGQALYEKLIRRVRTRATMAVLSLRTSTAVLNVANAPLMMMYCGVDNFISAFKTFWAHPKANWWLVNSLSPFMAKRSERMDTNLREAMESQNKQLHASKLTGAIMNNGFKLIGLTDNMFAYPLWYSEYRKTLNEEIQMGHDNETAQKAAIAAGDRAVVRVIGSGEMKDLSRAQKGGEIAKAFTMFYTFYNALYNMVANKYYAGLQAAERSGKTGWRRYASRQFMIPMAHYLLLGVIVNSMIEMGVRGAMDALSGRDDKKEKDAAYWLRKFSQTSMDNQAATIPVLRDMWRPISRSIFEPDAKIFGNSAKMTSAFDTFVRLSNAGVTTNQFLKNDGQKNLADFVRDSGKAIDGITGFPDMVTDGIANSIQYFLYPNSERDLRQLMGAIVMDRKLAKPKKNTAKKTGDPFKDAKRKAQRERNAAKKKAKNKVK